MPSPRPVNPRCSVVFAFTDTRSVAAEVGGDVRAHGGDVRRKARRLRDDRRVDVADRITRADTCAATWRSSIAAVRVLPARIGVGEVPPMSPSAAAPSSASAMACSSTSASEWPSSPRSNGIVTPPSTSGRPGDQRMHVEAGADARSSCAGARSASQQQRQPLLVQRDESPAARRSATRPRCRDGTRCRCASTPSRRADARRARRASPCPRRVPCLPARIVTSSSLATRAPRDVEIA